MAVLVKTCCCGCSLRKDVLILGILGLVSCSSYKSYKYLKYPSAFHTLVMVVPGLTIFTISYKSRTLSSGKSMLRAKISHAEFYYVALNNYTNITA